MSSATATHESVQEYYGRVLQHSSHLKTDACCSTDSLPHHLKSIVAQLAPEITERFYGCGSPISAALDGCTVLDLGCGTGRDAFICAKLVGPRGRVIGLDMTDEQLRVARAHERKQAQTFGFEAPNTRFVHGYLENLAAAGVEDGSVDVVISNCVINLAPNKRRVFEEVFRVLKPGGELYFADTFADRRGPAEWLEDQVLLGECLAGALYWEDFRRMLLDLGVPDVRVMTRRPVQIANPEIEERVGTTRFESVTVRAFKLDSLEDRCEDYGQVATYLGTLRHAPHVFVLDDHHAFFRHKPMLVCGNTAAMLAETRLAPHFRVDGDRSRHFGLFPCGPASVAGASDGLTSGGCC